jgi:iron-sulfur cluster repair protein YtfE (RIC family)
LCGAHHIPWEEFNREISGLPDVGETTDWNQSPVSHLLDFLCREHWEFIHSFFPSIKEAIHSWKPGRDDWESIKCLRDGWPGFAASLVEHIHEEEGFLFPSILRYDYCLRHKTSHPDFSQGSVNVFIAIRLLGNEWRMLSLIRKFLEESGFLTQAGLGDSAGENPLHALLDRFRIRLESHSNLETGVLYPIARKIERALYDAHISGQPTLSN